MSFVLFLSTIISVVSTYFIIIKKQQLKSKNVITLGDEIEYKKSKYAYMALLIINIIVLLLFSYDNFYYINKNNNKFIDNRYTIIKETNIVEKEILECKKRLFDFPKCTTVKKEWINLDYCKGS